MIWTYAYLLSWIGGGIALLAMLLLRTVHRPYGLVLGCIAFGAAGFLSLGLGATHPPGWAAGGALLGGALGYGLGRLRSKPESLIMELPLDR